MQYLKSVFWILAILTVSIYSEEEWTVADVQFRGNEALSRGELLANMETTPPRFLIREEFDFATLDQDIENIELLYRTIGYPYASVYIHNIERDTATMSVVITLDITEGPLVVVDTVKIINSQILSSNDIYAFIEVLPEAPLDSPGVHSDGRMIRDSLRGLGYLQASVYSKQVIDEQTLTATVYHRIDAGPLIIVKNFNIYGLQRVHETVVKREITFDSGTVLSTPVIHESLRRVYSTALFNFVQVKPDTTRQTMLHDTANVAVSVQLREAPFITLKAGIGYDSEEQFYLSIETAYRNLFRRGHRISLLGRASQPVRNAQATYSVPWFLSLPIWADFSIYAERRNETNVEGYFDGAIAALRGQIRQNLRFNLWTRLERTEWATEEPPADLFPLLPISPTHLIATTIIYDNRASAVDPGSALFASVQPEIAGIAGFGNQYVRLLFDFRGYLPFHFERGLVSSGFFTGIAFPYGEEQAIPTRERFRTGEAPVRDVRGYTLEEVTPFDDEDILPGGNFALIVNPVEISYQVTDGLEGALFIDGGNVWSDITDFSFEDFRWAVGMGIRVIIPIGLVRLDYGQPLLPEVIFPGRFHLNVGLPF
ncbi:BamA/TamA family outer membrane protein [Chitinispirillales bacterium ANBcel5]|uniref:BamA/OMP85 family outer membrane protein n=1 Tax=Cellulosispirillum alkaliphilum TaxID=3039283 RepID=UPI002A58F3B6|nr:BamA/TamA family outer membrane protein [Chitinispirillales bacterium ANBcel5]